MKTAPLISHDLAARRIEDAIRLRVGAGRRYSFESLSDATGVPERTLRSYTQGATPGTAALLSLFCVLGPSFTSDILADCGQAARSTQDDPPEHMKTLSRMLSLSALLSEALEDGKVDHRERAALRPVAAELIGMLDLLARTETSEEPSRVRFKGAMT